MDTTRRLLGGWLFGRWLWGGDGYSRAHYTRVVDPDIVRSLEVGQAAYIYRGGVTYVQVKRLIAGPPGIAATAARPGPTQPRPAAVPGHPPHAQVPKAPTAPAAPPDAGPLLDEVFGSPPADQHSGDRRHG